MKYGKEITREICEHLAGGIGRVDACILADISYDTFTVWMEKPEFSEAIKKAEAISKAASIQIVRKAAKKTWTAAAWWLERKYRSEFGQKVDVAGEMTLSIKGLADLVRKARAERGLKA